MEYEAVWRASLPYMRARKNDVHIPFTYRCAEQLLPHFPEADREVVLVAILMHDLGWAVVDQKAIYEEGFGENHLESDIKREHEVEGAKLARDLLPPLGFDPGTVERVAEIIDGHDTRMEALSLEDQLVKDADKLWRFTPTGVSIVCDWFKITPAEYASRLESRVIAKLFTDPAREIARASLAESRDLLKLDILR